MNVVRIVIIVVALGIAALAAFLVKGFLERQQAELQARAPAVEARPAPTVEVLLAERDLAAGTIVTVKDLRWQPWPEGKTNEKFIIKSGQADQIKDLQGAAVRRAILAGEPILSDKLAKKGDGGFMPAVLGAGMRAFSLSVDAVTGTSGFILPGVLVDVILTEQVTAGGEGGQARRVVSQTILEAARVIAIDQTADDLDETPKLSRTVTLEVTPKQAELLAVARSMGIMTLVLRSIGGAPDDGVKKVPTFDGEVSQFLRTTQNAVPHVMTAARDLPAGSLLKDTDLVWREVTAETGDNVLRDDAAKRLSFRGALLKRDVRAGAAVPADSIVRAGEQGFLTAALGPGMRALAVEIAQVSGVAGYIAPGDRVDVILTQSLADQSRILSIRRVSETVVGNVRVLNLEQTVDPTTGQPKAGQTATLELSPKQAELVAVAREMGKLVLALRNGSAEPERGQDRRPFTTDLSVSPATVDLILNGTRNAPELRRTDRGGGAVRLYRSLTPETVTFN